MGRHGRSHWRHNGARLKIRSALGAGNALVGAAIGHKDERRSGRKPRLEPYENIDENIAAVVKVDERGHFLDGSNLNDLRARQPQQGPGAPNVVVSTVIHVVLENGSTAGKFTVSTLPATVSNSGLGRVTIPAENDSQIAVSTTPPNNPPLPAPAPTLVPSGPSPGDSTANPPANPTSPIPNSSATSSGPPQSTTDMATSSSAPAPEPSNVPPPASSPKASPPSTSSTSASEQATLPTFIVLPIPTNSTSATSIPPVARIGILPSSEPVSQRLLPSTDSGPTTSTSTFLSSLPSSSALLAPVSSTSIFSHSSLSSPSSTASASSSTTTGSTSVIRPSYTGGFGGGGVGGGSGSGYGDATATGPGGIPTFAGGDPADDSDSSVVPASKVVGGVVGGVAGVVLLLAVALLLLRTRKRKGDHSRELTSEDQGTAAMLHTGFAGAMTERSASTTTRGSALGAAALFSKWRNSQQSTRTLEPPPSSERGFQKVSGRKITSVLESGGDGYDDPFGATGEKLYYETTAAASTVGETGSPTTITPIVPPFSSGFQPRPSISRNGTSRSAGLIAQPLHAPPLGRPPSQESDSSAHVVFRPSPARTPLTSSADVTTASALATSGSIALHPPPHESLPRLPVHRRISGQDAIGRSMASSDGSRASRFTEGI
ncbi:hypothetical protein AJ78_06161 [Emergomyces pasteurianus Ep9510]|uniref:Uncharacterized protein n=1 Tax=Emergomyces pasteurianus Ep9510 TaxID=1447872 RepID=A0A1J9QBU2_9EURO|nr:hypothetical protein AJ78_06161 [Emergomyces pasteurianus Ep9510]